MTRNDFINATPPMPDSFVLRMERTLEGKEAYLMKRNRAKRLTIIAALIGALMIAGGAIALKQSGLLNYLFYDKQPTKEAIELVQSVDESQTCSGVTVTIDEYAYDGENVAVSYTLTNSADETLIVYNEQGVGFGALRDEAGSLVNVGGGWSDDGEMCFIGGEVNGVKLENSLNCGKQGSVSAQSRSQTLTFTVSAGIYRPLVPLASSDETAGGGDTLVLQGNRYSWSSARNEAAVAQWAEKGNDTAYEGETLEAMGRIEKIGSVSVTKTLTPKRSEAKGITLEKPITLDAGDCLLTLEYVDFGALASKYGISIRPKDGSSYKETDGHGPLYAWQCGDILDDKGEPIGFSGGGSYRTAPDGTGECYGYREAGPLTVMPTSFTLCPQKENYVWREGDGRNERYDLTKAIRLEIIDGVIVPPEAPNDRKVAYAPDFTADEAGTGEILSVKAKTWDEATITRVLAQGEKLTRDEADPGDFRGADGTIVIMDRYDGRFFFRSGKLGNEYGSTLMILKPERKNAGGSIDGFSAEQALCALDSTLLQLGLSRGRTAYQTAYTKEELMKTWAEQQAEYKLNRGGSQSAREDEKELRERFEKKALSLKTPEGGYYITFSLDYNGLDCVLEDKPTYGLSERLPAGSSLAAFVNPDGVLFLQTLDYSAVYEASDTGEAITPISLDAAKSAAETHLSRGEADRTVVIKRAFYEYKPVWSGENNSQLTLRPIWGFYAEREDGAPYPLAYVDAENGEIRF